MNDKHNPDSIYPFTRTSCAIALGSAVVTCLIIAIIVWWLIP
jgi:hypothetical protein